MLSIYLKTEYSQLLICAEKNADFEDKSKRKKIIRNETNKDNQNLFY